MDEAFEKVGGFGKFQKVSAIINMLAQGGAAFLLTAFAFLEKEPIFKCQMDPPSNEWTYGYEENTLKEEFCAKDYHCEVHWDDVTSLHNVIG